MCMGAASMAGRLILEQLHLRRRLYNLMTTTLFSKEFDAFDSGSCEEFKGLVWGIMETVGKPNVADYFPVFRALDPQGILRKSTVYIRKCFDIFDEIIRERLKIRGRSADGTRKITDMLESLLEINERDESELSILDIKHLLLGGLGL